MGGLPKVREASREYAKLAYYCVKKLEHQNTTPVNNNATASSSNKKNVFQPYHGTSFRWVFIFLPFILCCVYWMLVVIQHHMFLASEQGLSKYAGSGIQSVMSNRSLIELVKRTEGFNNTLCRKADRERARRIGHCRGRMTLFTASCTEKMLQDIQNSHLQSPTFQKCNDDKKRVGRVVQEFSQLPHNIFVSAYGIPLFLVIHGFLHSRSHGSFGMFAGSLLAFAIIMGLHWNDWPVATFMLSTNATNLLIGYYTKFHKKCPEFAVVVILCNVFYYCLFVQNMVDGNFAIYDYGLQNDWTKALAHVFPKGGNLGLFLYQMAYGNNRRSRWQNTLPQLYTVVCSTWILFWWTARYVLLDYMDWIILRILQGNDYKADCIVWSLRTFPTVFLTRFAPDTWKDLHALGIVGIFIHILFSSYMHRQECLVINAWKIGKMHSAIHNLA